MRRARYNEQWVRRQAESSQKLRSAQENGPCPALDDHRTRFAVFSIPFIDAQLPATHQRILFTLDRPAHGPGKGTMTHILASLKTVSLAFAASFALMGSASSAQELESIDPDAAYTGAIDGDLFAPASELPASDAGAAQSVTNTTTSAAPATTNAYDAPTAPEWADPVSVDQAPDAVPPPTETTAANAGVGRETTYGEDDLIGAAEGVFGKGAKGLAGLIEKALKDQGEPNAYIVGREAGGAFVVGARYGSGKLYHKIEGERPVYWTGPSVGFDAGANAGNTFILVYNLYDSEELYERYPAGEGQAYVVGGMHASYLRKGDVVMIPIRVGAGLRLGVNAGYMRFSKKQRWLPF